MGTIAHGAKAESKKAIGKMISLLRNEPLVIAQSTGSSREAAKPEAFEH